MLMSSKSYKYFLIYVNEVGEPHGIYHSEWYLQWLLMWENYRYIHVLIVHLTMLLKSLDIRTYGNFHEVKDVSVQFKTIV